MQPHFADMSNDYSNSPTIFYPPAPQHHFGPFNHQAFQTPLSQWAPPASSSVAPAPPTRPQLRTNPSRKRSRDEFDDEEDLPNAATDAALAEMEVVDEPVYGEGMTLIDPKTGRVLSAGSQTGTWYEEQLEEERKAAAQAAEELARAAEEAREEARGRPTKSVRLDSPAPFSQSDAPSSTTSFVAAPAPAIDAASLMLGIGWKTIPDDDDLKCAARGWARYIENHYPTLGGVEIMLKSDGNEAFLVRVLQPYESWWLFKEDLTEGKLVARNWEACVANLRASPMVFESQDSLCAVRTPALIPDVVEEPCLMNETINGQSSGGMELD